MWFVLAKILSLIIFGVISLTHKGRVTHICVSKLTIIGSDNIWANAGILLIGPSGTNFNEILIEIRTFSFKKMRLKVSSAKRRPFCLGLNVLILNSICISVSEITDHHDGGWNSQQNTQHPADNNRQADTTSGQQSLRLHGVDDHNVPEMECIRLEFSYMDTNINVFDAHITFINHYVSICF